MKNQIALFGLIMVLFCPGLQAKASDEEVQALREQIRLLSLRLDQLESAQQKPQAAATSSADAEKDSRMVDEKIEQAITSKLEGRMTAGAWADRMRWSGDFRYRYENLDKENSASRERNRIRARALLEAEVSTTMRAGLGLVSGGEDPVSGNQTLGGGGSSKSINLDLAYFEWTGLENTRVLGGKFKNQLYRPGGSALLWDSDWRPEGASVSYDNGTLFVHALGTWLESDSNKSQQEFSPGLQVGVTLPLGKQVELTAGIGYYQFDTAGKRAFFADGDFSGNSFDAATMTYLFDYQEIEGFAELSFDVAGKPATLFANYVQNQDAGDNDSGYAFGIQYGKAKAQGTWAVSYTYQKLEADAVIGLLTNSDFGDGGTDSKGSVFGAAYAFHDNWFFEGSYFLNQINLSSGNARDVDRLQLDLNFKFK